MSVWDILEIDSAADVSAIKKAYAKKLRQHHPEDDPEGYQRLREAFDSAMKQAKRRQAAMEQASLGSNPEAEYDEEAEEETVPAPDSRDRAVMPAASIREEELQPAPVHPVYEFMERVEALYNDFKSRLDPSAWEELLNTDVVWNVELADDLQYALISFLEDHRHLPTEVWAVLDTMFRWSERRKELIDIHGFYTFEVLHKGIHGMTGLGYTQFQGRELPEDFDPEYYLDLREEAQQALADSDWEEAKNTLEEARSLFAEDPDVELMRAKLFEKTGEPELAISCYTLCAQLSPKLEEEARRHRGRLLFEQGQAAEALEDFKWILDRQPEDEDAMVRLALCQESLGMFKEAIDNLKQANINNSYYVPPFAYWKRSMSLYQRDNTKASAADKRKRHYNNMLYAICMFIRMTWLFWAILLLLSLLFSLHPVYYGLFGVIFLINGWRVFRMVRYFTT